MSQLDTAKLIRGIPPKRGLKAMFAILHTLDDHLEHIYIVGRDAGLTWAETTMWIYNRIDCEHK